MSEETGPELALATAKAMGKADVYMDGTIEPECRRRALFGGHPWRPDLGGAAGAEVLDWLRANGQEVSMLDNDMSGPPHLCELSRDGAEVSAQGLGETHWIALCRAVVEVGK